MTNTKEVTLSNIREKIPRNSFIITIDGPTGTGKEVLSRGLANRYDLVFINTGVSFRAIALLALENQIIIPDDDENIVLGEEDRERLKTYIESLPELPRFEKPMNNDHTAVCYIGDKNVLDAIHMYDNQSHIETISTAIAAIPKAREKLYTTWKQAQQKFGGVVVDGRKTGVDLFPDAQIKIYLVANPEISAQYRQRGGITATRSPITEEYYIKHRDEIEAKAGLLEIPKGSIELNTTLYLSDSQGEQLLVSDIAERIDARVEIV